MASPQKENGYTPISNEIMEALARNRLSGRERQILDVILRKTYGFNKLEDAISMSQFSKLTGMKRPDVAKQINTLLAKKLIGVSQKANSNVNYYLFIKDYEKWKVLPKKKGVSQKANTLLVKTLTEGVSQNTTYKRNNTKDTYTKGTKERANEFDIFYAAYPKHVKKKDTLKAWEKLKPSVELVGIIMDFIKQAKTSIRWTDNNGQYIPDPSTFLNGHRWEDELTFAPKKFDDPERWE